MRTGSMRGLALGALGLGGLAVLAAALPSAAQQVGVGGEIRPRFEIRSPVPGPVAGEDETSEFTSMRTRLSVGTALGDGLRVFAQLQDVRIWGSEAGTTDPMADGLDFHQAWLELGDPEEGRVTFRLGRQELAYGEERIIGALNWAQQARAFDGGRLRYRHAEGVTLDAVAMRIGDADAGRPDEGLYGLYGTYAYRGTLDGYVLYHTADELRGTGQPVSADLSKTLTTGARWSSVTRGIDWRVEAAYQFGEHLGQPVGAGEFEIDDVSAYLLALRAGTRLTEELGLSVWYDRLSGDDDPTDGTRRVFDTLFATNHKFYGFMDLFTNIPVHTDGRGLQDLAIRAGYALSDNESLGLDLHSFWLANSDGLDSGHIGEELDLTYNWAYAPGVSLSGGLSYFLAGSAAPVPAAPAADDGMVWGYLMMGVRF